MAEPIHVGIVGAGRMGRALAARLDGAHTLTVVSRRPGLLTMTDREVRVGAEPAAVRGCAVVLLAVPAAQVMDALRWVGPDLDPGAVAVNLATELATPEVDGVRLVACKVIGQSGQIERGVPAAFVVDGARKPERELLTQALRGIGVVVSAPEQIVSRVNEFVARYMIGMQRDLARALDEFDLPAPARDAAIMNLAVGVWQAVASGNTGPFLTALLAESTGAHQGDGA